jgi:nicotinamide-nucleotide amidase
MTTFDPETLRLAGALLASCRARGLSLATAESCTGGMICGALTAIAGSSDVVIGGFVSYSNDAKQRWLGVPAATLRRHGAVSAETAVAMAEGAFASAPASLTLAATGIAGPGGGTAEKPVGLVYIASARSGTPTVVRRLDLGARDRDEIRRLTVLAALRLGRDQAAAPVPPA